MGSEVRSVESQVTRSVLLRMRKIERRPVSTSLWAVDKLADSAADFVDPAVQQESTANAATAWRGSMRSRARRASAPPGLRFASTGSIRFMAKSNSGWSHAHFVPKTPHNCGHSRQFTVSAFLWIEGNRLARASSDSSSKLVMRVRFSSPAP
jgi:hypothetical protein